MIIEFRNSEGSELGAFERTSLGGPKMEYADNPQGREQRMIVLGCPSDLAKRAARREMRALPAKVLGGTRPSSLQERIAAVNALVAADIAAGRILDENTRTRIAKANALVAADRKAGLV